MNNAVVKKGSIVRSRSMGFDAPEMLVKVLKEDQGLAWCHYVTHEKIQYERDFNLDDLEVIDLEAKFPKALKDVIERQNKRKEVTR